MRKMLTIAGALALSACSGGGSSQWQPSDGQGYQAAPSASDTLILSGMTADSYDAAIGGSPSLAANTDYQHVGHEIRTHDEAGKLLDSELNHRLSRQF